MMHLHTKTENERPLRFSELRAVNNIKALGESIAAHWFDLLNGDAKQLCLDISACLVPTTGCAARSKDIAILEAIYSYEKEFRCRVSVLSRISAALKKNRNAYERYGLA
jgi:hypothetical protein